MIARIFTIVALLVAVPSVFPIQLGSKNEIDKTARKARRQLSRTRKGQEEKLFNGEIVSKPRLRTLKTTRADRKKSKSSKTGEDGEDEGPDGEDGSKSGKSMDSDSEERGEEVINPEFLIAPFSCPRKCLDGAGTNADMELNSTIMECNPNTMTHKWSVDEIGSVIKIENVGRPGLCISAFYLPGDSERDIEMACTDGTLALLNCTQASSEWYFTGGQLLSQFCWDNGVSASMSVTIDDNNVCVGDIYAEGTGGSGDMIWRTDTFLFLDP